MIPWTLRRWLGLPHPEPDRSPVEPGPRPPNAAWHHDLATAILEGRDDDAPYLAYAEWLEANNDPRAAAIRGDLDVVGAHPDHFLGPLAFDDTAEVTWKRGFWETLRFRVDHDVHGLPDRVRAALSHPSALVLTRLEVVADAAPDIADILADGDVLPVRQLAVDACGGPLGAWAAVWSRLPELQTLELVGDDAVLGDVDLPALQSLVIRGRLSEDAAWSLARMNAPHLSRLETPPLPDAPRAMLAERFPDL